MVYRSFSFWYMYIYYTTDIYLYLYIYIYVHMCIYIYICAYVCRFYAIVPSATTAPPAAGWHHIVLALIFKHGDITGVYVGFCSKNVNNVAFVWIVWLLWRIDDSYIYRERDWFIVVVASLSCNTLYLCNAFRLHSVYDCFNEDCTGDDTNDGILLIRIFVLRPKRSASLKSWWNSGILLGKLNTNK